MSTYIIENEPAISALADGDSFVVYDLSTKSTRGVTTAQVRAQIASGIVDATAATLAVTQAAHGGETITLNRAAGIAAIFRFFVGTTVTSNSTTIKVGTAAETMRGNALVLQDAADTLVGFEAGATADTITLNGTTTGGIVGDFVELIDIAANMYYVRCLLSGTGTEATPFSATVS
jgi:hypothetical protein